MKKLKRTLREVDPEFGDVQWSKLRGDRIPTVATGPRNRKAHRARKRRRRRDEEPASDYPPPTPKLDCRDPEWVLLKRQVLTEEDRCRYCGSTDCPTVDHIIPRHHGGGYHRSNLQRLCENCNQRKGLTMVVPDYATRPVRPAA